MISFTVYGRPAPAGSKRAFIPKGSTRAVVTDANAKAKPWKADVRREAAFAMAGKALFPGPVSLRLAFYQPRPRSHYRTGKNASRLRDAAPWAPMVKPDLLKLARAIEDAMTGICYFDDSQIVDEVLSKRYGTPERVEVTLDYALMDVAHGLGR